MCTHTHVTQGLGAPGVCACVRACVRPTSACQLRWVQQLALRLSPPPACPTRGLHSLPPPPTHTHTRPWVRCCRPQVTKRGAEVAEGKLGVYHDESSVPQDVGWPWPWPR